MLDSPPQPKQQRTLFDGSCLQKKQEWKKVKETTRYGLVEGEDVKNMYRYEDPDNHAIMAGQLIGFTCDSTLDSENFDNHDVFGPADNFH
ncbi:uncharacterized protein N7482_007589 [Penicillium canariense]|uniref:Uncharacterized protein n=1 Tax=Penicillium canariense TaxID=189055 RepID=A0A9W9I202_9EURO|nr:uncharacterized protein N7482_007589 [Penicillium canariense]KAJ5160585.1 hypothetical protein N7482_007589 [Penicillium canariense]